MNWGDRGRSEVARIPGIRWSGDIPDLLILEKGVWEKGAESGFRCGPRSLHGLGFLEPIGFAATGG